MATALLSGIDTYADYLLSVHMVEHMLLMMVAPVLIAWGAPVRLALAACGRGRRAIAVAAAPPRGQLATRPAFGTWPAVRGDVADLLHGSVRAVAA